jgi:hypothetical protein
MEKKVKKVKVVHIESDLHERIREYCDKNGYKINKWLEIQLTRLLNDLDKKPAN